MISMKICFDEKEINLYSESNQRLGCQMVIKGGTVKLQR